MSDRYRRYGLEVAIAVLLKVDACLSREELKALVDSIEPPAPTQAESYDAPTGDGWWWAKMGPAEGEWHVVEVISNDDGKRWCEMTGLSAGLDIESLTIWVGPLTPPEVKP